MTPSEVISALVSRLRDNPKVTRIVLFGSRARGDNFPRSDIDLAVSLPEGTILDWQAVTDATEEVNTLLSVDLVRLEDAPAELKTRIQTEGEVLYER